MSGRRVDGMPPHERLPIAARVPSPARERERVAATGIPSVTPHIVAGIGFRRGADAAEIAALIERALAQAGADRADLRAVATAADRADEPAIREAAARFGLVPVAVPPDALLACDARVPTRSDRIERLRGVGSLAEAAALAVSGPDGRVALARIASAGATCALARAGGEPGRDTP